MKVFKIEDYINMENPIPGEPYRPEILKGEDGAKHLGAMFAILSPGNRVPYHYHQKRESIITVINGEGIEIVEGEEFLIKKGDIIFIPSGKKHMTINNSDKDLRYIEFFTNPPLNADFISAK